MQFLFSPDSKIMQFLSRLCDIAVLNLLFLLSCVPVVTIGAASTALYSVVFAMDTDREGGFFSAYFRSFRRNFWQSTLIFLVLALFGGASCMNVLLFSQMGGGIWLVLYGLALLILLVIALTAAMVFPLVSQFQNKTMAMMKNAFLLSLANLPRAMLAAVVNGIPMLLVLLSPYLFLQLGGLWMFLYFGATAYFLSRVLKKVFDPLIPQE